MSPPAKSPKKSATCSKPTELMWWSPETAVAPDSEKPYYGITNRLEEAIEGAYQPNQFFNSAAPESHYETTGPEIRGGYRRSSNPRKSSVRGPVVRMTGTVAISP